MKVGVLALQGDFLEHRQVLEKLGVAAPEVRLPGDLDGLDALIIPGGESTSMGKLAQAYGLAEEIRQRAQVGFPLWGTCAGMILLAKDIGREQPLLGVMDMKVERNAFGRQVDSFEADLEVPALASLDPEQGERPFPAVFIRAPTIPEVGKKVEVLARLEDGRIVAARQGVLLATAFHPELTEDTRFHRYFLRLIDAQPNRAEILVAESGNASRR